MASLCHHLILRNHSPLHIHRTHHPEVVKMYPLSPPIFKPSPPPDSKPSVSTAWTATKSPTFSPLSSPPEAILNYS